MSKHRKKIAKVKGKLYQAYHDMDYDAIEKYKAKIGELVDQLNIKTKYNQAYINEKTSSEAKQHEVSVFYEGQQYVMLFSDERVANAINKADYEAMSGYLKNWFGKGTRWLAAMATSKNPSFAVVNFLRDFGFANLTHLLDNGLVYSGKFNKNVFNPQLQAAIYRNVTGSKKEATVYDEMLKEFFADGAATGYAFLKDVDQIKANIVKEFSQQKDNPYTWTKRQINSLGNVFSAITEYSELITRFATYLTSREMGRSRHQAVVDAKNVTINFNRKGTMSPALNMLYMFFNASIQGGMRAMDVVSRNKGKFAGVAASLALFGFLNTLFTLPSGDGDDENRKFSEYDRQHHIIVGGVQIPLPHFFRAFWGFGVQAALTLKGEKDGKEATFDSFRMLGSEFVLEQVNLLEYMKYNDKSKAIEFDREAIVSLLPSILKPFGEIAINRDFSGRRIYKEPYVNSDKIPKAFWAMPDVGNLWQEISYLLLEAGGGDRHIRKLYNNETGLYINEWLNVNPEALEHLFTSWTGGTGRFFNDTYKTLYNATPGKFEATTTPAS